MGRAQTIQIYLPSGDPAGLRVANLTTRTVRVFEVPRPLLSEFLKRPEAAQVGVYYFFGSSEDDTPQCYIGQSGSVGVRLQQHTGTKDFWTKAMVAVSLTNQWTSTHVAYLEWLSLSAGAKVAGRYAVVNGNQASNPFTPEPPRLTAKSSSIRSLSFSPPWVHRSLIRYGRGQSCCLHSLEPVRISLSRCSSEKPGGCDRLSDVGGCVGASGVETSPRHTTVSPARHSGTT